MDGSGDVPHSEAFMNEISPQYRVNSEIPADNQSPGVSRAVEYSIDVNAYVNRKLFKRSSFYQEELIFAKANVRPTLSSYQWPKLS